jgi:hypothetical protein
VTMPSPDDIAAISRQLGRSPRGRMEVAYRCPCGDPAVVRTHPRLDDGSPFPTLYYLTCPRASAACSRLESGGVMRDMETRLTEDVDLRDSYIAAHETYLRERESLEYVEEISGVTAGGMPDRVKCLHVLLAHSLAVGPGINLLGDEVREAIGDWWEPVSCREMEA